MSYFSMFPHYITKITDGTQITITDFFRRIKVANRYTDATTGLMPYVIADGERPETIANRVYGSPFYHWVVLHVNNIVSPYTEWPLNTREVILKIYYTYDYDVLVPDLTEYTVNDMLTSTNGGRFIVTAINSTTISVRSTNGQTFLSSADRLINITRGTTNLVILLSSDPQNIIHHYMDAVTKYQIDYNALNPNCIPVTNLEYELTLNEGKRDIQLLDPAFLQQFVTNFQRSINT